MPDRDGYPQKIAIGSRSISKSRSSRWGMAKLIRKLEGQVTVTPVQCPGPGGLGIAEPGDRGLCPLRAKALAPGRPGTPRSSGAGADVAFHPDLTAGCSATRCSHLRRTRAMSSSGVLAVRTQCSRTQVPVLGPDRAWIIVGLPDQCGLVTRRSGAPRENRASNGPASASVSLQPAPLLLHSVAHSRQERWEDRQPPCFTCSRW